MTRPLSAAGEAGLAAYGRLTRRRLLVGGLTGLAVLLALAADLVTGPSGLGVRDVLTGVLDPAALPRHARVILLDVRLPTSLLALAVGAALALAGAEMQTVLANPLASPFTLGVSSAAALGAALAIVLGVGLPGVPPDWIVSGNAFLFALGATLLLQAVTRLKGAGTETMVLFGIALVFAFNALVALMQFVASEQALQQLVFWTMGSLSRATYGRAALLGGVVALVLPFSLAASWRMTALRLGEERARGFGIDVGRLRFLSLLRISLLTATAVAFVGTIGFVGLVGPHIARLLVGEDHRVLLPVSALTGAGLMLLASVAGKLLVPGAVMPVGIVTALIGLPVFVALIFGRGGRP